MGGGVAVAAPDAPVEPRLVALLPSRPGTYVLFLHLARDVTLTVGRLGRFRFPAGFYGYVGSARGSGGIASRVARHLRHPKPAHWHIDALRAVARPVRVWWAEGTERRECAWAAALAGLEGGSVPVRGFGSSDCRCRSHLIHFSSLPRVGSLAQAVGTAVVEVILDG